MINKYADKNHVSYDEAKKAYDNYLKEESQKAAKQYNDYVNSPQFYEDNNALLTGREYSFLPFNQHYNPDNQ